jgi:antitoxin (DNA-binding transcriptional repressor) of toxin-antitoxin stability system
MTVVNMHDAKTRLSKLVVVIAVNGTPAARLVPIEPRPKVKWGLLKGKIAVPDNIDELNPEIEKLFYGEAD